MKMNPMTSIPQSERKVTVYWHIPEDLHTLLKSEAALRKLHLRDFAISVLASGVERERKEKKHAAA